MDSKVPSSMPPENQMPQPEAPQAKAFAQNPVPSLEQIMQAKRALQAMQQPPVAPQYTQPQPPAPQPQVAPQEPRVVYVRRNLTIAELIVVLAISCGLVFGVQFISSKAMELLPRIEVRVK